MRAMLFLALTAALLGCANTSWRDPGEGTEVPDNAWYDNGAVVFMGHTGLSAYKENGAALLAARLGGGLALDLALTESAAQGVDFSFGGPDATSQLHPAGLSLTVDEDHNHVLMTASFATYSHKLIVSAGDTSCEVVASTQELATTITMAAQRDLAGHIALRPLDQEPLLVVGPVSVTLHPTCELSAPVAAAVRGAVMSAVTDALGVILSSPVGLTAELESLAATLLATDVPARLVRAPVDGGQLDVAVAPHVPDANKPVLVAAAGAVVTPLRVAVFAEAAPCVAGLTLPARALPKQVAAPEMPAEPTSDVVVALRLDMLDAVVTESFRGGALCITNGFSGPAEMSLGDVRWLVGASMPFDDSAAVALRVRPGAAPSLAWSDDGTASLELPALTVELYARGLGQWWLAWTSTSDITISKATPQITGSPDGLMLRFVGGLWSSSDGLDTAKIVEESLVAATDGLALFALPLVYPYPLADVDLRITTSHLMLTARLDTSHAPAVGTMAAPLTREQPAASACSASHRGQSPVAPGLLMLMWLLTRRQRRCKGAS